MSTILAAPARACPTWCRDHWTPEAGVTAHSAWTYTGTDHWGKTLRVGIGQYDIDGCDTPDRHIRIDAPYSGPHAVEDLTPADACKLAGALLHAAAQLTEGGAR